MKFVFTFALLCILSFNSFSQIEIRGSMGINFLSNPSLTDYVNQNFAPYSQKLSSFNTAVNFSVEGGYYLKENFQMGLEIAYLLNSYSYPAITGSYDFSYNIIMPTVTSYYVIQGQGYNFKFGGGLGIRISNVSETLPQSTISTSYSALGFGFLLRADGNTALSNNVYANIGGDIRYDLNGEPKNGNNYIVNINNNVNLNSLSLGVRLGITYRF
jgi:hypothetical protein